MSDEEPKVYIATYSSTDVYECQINDIPIMRRCKDDWVNATQILKCCNFPKAKRTKILEKGVQQGQHEKIQGGYGRFQGTWIPLPDAQRLAANYGVTGEMAPVLYLDLSDPNVVIPKKVKQVNKDGTPVKRKYTKKAKKLEDTPSKKLKSDIGSHEAMNSLSRTQSHLSSFGSQQTPARQFQQMQYQLQQQGQLPPTFTQVDFMAMNGNMNGSMNGGMNGGMNGSMNGSMNGNINGIPAFSSHQQMVQNEFQNYQMQLQGMEQQKLYQGSLVYPQLPVQHQPQMMGFSHNKVPSSQSTNETNWSQEDSNNLKESDTSISSNDENVKAGSKMDNVDVTQSPRMDEDEDDNSYASQLLKFFSDDNPEIPYFIHNPPFDFNINEPIDDEGHTPLHWAASIGNYPMIHVLLSKGASPLVVNNFGLNPLSKLISFNNCYELKNFPKVLDELELCLINTDINGRTPLHYLSQFAKVKSKYESLRYYLNIVLNKLSSLSNHNPSKQVDLLKNVLDHQDVNGDTAIHLAAKAGSSKIVKILLDYGSRDDLENIHKETAKALISSFNLLPNYNSSQQQFQQSQFSQQSQQFKQQSQFRNAPQPSQQFQNPQKAIRNQSQGEYNQRQESTYQNQILSTPIQSRFVGGEIMETPDTQKTTVQDDDDDVSSQVARVNKDHLDSFIENEDNKENIFVNGTMKNFDSMSTPISKQPGGGYTSSSVNPLAVISERTIESTPIKNNEKILQSAQQSYKIQPPKLDKDGHLVDGMIDIENNQDKKLSMHDLTSMVSGMINSLSESYNGEMDNLNKKYQQLSKELSTKQKLNDSSVEKINSMITKIGGSDVNTIDQGNYIISKEVESYEQKLNEGEKALFKTLKKNSAFKVANLAQEYEHKHKDLANEASNEGNWEFAIQLTKLQMQKDKLLNDVTKSTANYGIDSKMYKYRKLISLSCGLKVEDIDGLIDGIEESLMEASIC